MSKWIGRAVKARIVVPLAIAIGIAFGIEISEEDEDDVDETFQNDKR